MELVRQLEERVVENTQLPSLLMVHGSNFRDESQASSLLTVHGSCFRD